MSYRYALNMSAVRIPPSIEEVTNLLRGVIDPELGSDVVDLGMA
ncbi:MAG: Iron-sulfur cluster assembly protein, partial [Actinomycetota bacterium]